MDPTKESQSKNEWGLDFARKLDFTETHYEEALKMIKSPNNTNQLLLALLDVSSRGDQAQSHFDTQINHQPVERSKSSETTTRNQNEGSLQINSMQDVFVKNRSLYSSPSNTGTSTTSGSSSNLICFSKLNSLTATECYIESIRKQSTNFPQQSACHDLRKIYIDGSNVARTHGKDVEFSWPGICICVEWFRNRGHSVIKVFVSESKYQRALIMTSQVHLHETSGEYAMALDYLIRTDGLVKTPEGSNDDMFLLEAARLNNGVIVSNDLFREESRHSDELQKYIGQKKLPYIFDDDNFIPAYDPLGRYGPTRDQFLRSQDSNISSLCSNHDMLCRTQSNQRFERRSVYNLPKHHIGNSSAFQRRSLQSTHSSPLQQPQGALKNDSRDFNNESMESINLYQLQRSTRDDLNRVAFNRPKNHRISTSNPNSDNNKPNETYRSNSSITRRNAIIRTKSHN